MFKCETIFEDGVSTICFMEDEPPLRWLQNQVGGYIESPPFFEEPPQTRVYFDEEGLLHQLQPNLLATERALQLGYNLTQPLVGPVVFVTEESPRGR